MKPIITSDKVSKWCPNLLPLLYLRATAPSKQSANHLYIIHNVPNLTAGLIVKSYFRY